MTARPLEPLLAVEDLHVALQSRTHGRELTLIDGVSFALAHGESMGIVGESGSGKTMTALAVMRLLPRSGRVSRGVVKFRGEDLQHKTSEEMRQLRGAAIAMILQDPLAALDPLFTIGSQMVELLGVHRRITRAAAEARSIELLAQVGISDPGVRLRQYPHQVSGGMLQRIVGAMAIACEPALLIADEPTTALDPTVQAQYIDLLNALKARGRLALLLVTHDFGVAAHLCDKIVVMYAGRIVERAPARDIFADPKHPYTQALMGAVPEGPGRRRLPTIAGQPPDLADRPPGCAFAPRCRFVHDRCRVDPPEFSPNPGRGVACWLMEKECPTC